MRVDTTTTNPALISVINDPHQIITLDTNFLIPPYRPLHMRAGIDLKIFQQIWLDPITAAFPNLAIHEAVYEEIVDTTLRTYVDSKDIIIHLDSSLSETERILRDTIELKIASRTNYEPLLDNKDDRGEVKSLSYIAVKGLLYFAAHDNNAIQLIEKAEEWSTGLDNVQAIKIYELIFYLYIRDLADRTSLKMLYKYQYYLTEREKRSNPEWGEFTSSMKTLYESNIKE